MFTEFPDSMIDYCNPFRLESFKSSLYTNPVNSNFEELNLFELKCPSVKVQPLFLRNKGSVSVLNNDVPYCIKPAFLSQGIPCMELNTFTLKETSKNNEEKDLPQSLSFPTEDLKKLILPKFFKNRPNILRQTFFDEEFAHKVDLNVPSKPLKELIPNPAWEWPFELDMFQKQAIVALENMKSVFVSAHTSAGKTVVAEYAVAMCHNRGARVIYTSPIKALSNQKYREFKITFGNDNVGLLTGDIKTGANRYILIMTTEILHNMLKNDCETLRDLEVVIMDEVHYLNDDSRGHIWEQIMILLPKRIQLVMLSATVPNTMQFAEWLGRIRNTQIQVISTVKRPVPLEIYLFTGTSRNKRDQFYRIMDSNKNFIARNYQLADETIKASIEKSMKKYQTKPGNQNQNQNQNQQNTKTMNKSSKFQNPDLKLKHSDNYNKSNKDHNQWLALFEALKEKDNLPVICFMFSRNRIQSTVSDLKSINLLNEVEKSNVHRYFKEIINRKMSCQSDKKLPQVIEMQNLLVRGMAMHHAGLLPILKEIVEVLFSQGYVKILFATETFAVGVNMPARSVVFDSIQKHDGSKKRLLLPGEFTQMAGRAGRRGLDKIGTVIILIKAKTNIYSLDELKRIMIGSACQLESKFKISYNMILSLYRNRQFNIQYMIRHSFIEADRLKKYDENCQEYEELSNKLKLQNCSGIKCFDNKCDVDTIEKYYQECVQYRKLKLTINEIIENRNEIVNFLSPGRLVLLDSTSMMEINSKYRLLIPALVLSFVRQNAGGSDKYKFKVLTFDLSCDDENPKSQDKDSSANTQFIPIRPLIDQIVLKDISEVIPKILTIALNDVNKVCQTKNKIDVQEIEKYWMSRFFRTTSWVDWIKNSCDFKNAMMFLCNGVSTKLDMANYEKELNIKDSHQKQQIAKYFTFESSSSPLLDYNCTDCILLADHITSIHTTENMMVRMNKLQQNLSDENLAFLPEYRCKVALLKDLGFINLDKDTIKLKGRIACEIESYEIVVTEVILSGVFSEASPCDIAASLSTLMFESKSRDNQSFEFRLNEVSPSLQKILKEITTIVEKINNSQELFNIFGNEIQLNYGLVESVKMWTSGAKFSEIVEFTDIQYGDIVRCLQRLYELLRHCESAAKVMADFGMANLFKRTQECIFRGLISTSSLYVDDV